MLVREYRYTMFPGVSKEELAFLDERDILVVGKIHARPRRSRYATGFVLIVSHVGFADDSGNLIWAPIGS